MNKTELVAAMAKDTNLSKKDVEAQTGETMTIEASKSPKFKAGKALKDVVNGK